MGTDNTFVKALTSHLDQYNQNLRSLNLSNNQFNDKQIVEVLDSLIETRNDCLEKLKLAKNKLTDKVAFKFKEMFFDYNGCVLEYIDLSDNKINCMGGLAIADIVKMDPQYLRVLDLSWNKLCRQPPRDHKK